MSAIVTLCNDMAAERQHYGLTLGVLTFGTINSDTFSETTIRFRFGGLVMGVAFAMTLAMGVFGGLFPALRAVRLDIVRALREL